MSGRYSCVGGAGGGRGGGEVFRQAWRGEGWFYIVFFAKNQCLADVFLRHALVNNVYTHNGVSGDLQ